MNQPTQSTALKFDADKPRLDLLPSLPLLEIAQVLAFGAAKYGDYNWQLGMAYSRPYAATLRHLLAWRDGEVLDPESGLPHLAHAACNLLFLLHYEAAETGHNDLNPKANKGE